MANEHESLLRRWFDGIWNQGDIDIADQLMAPQGILHENAAGTDALLTLTEFKAMAHLFRGAIPDVRIELTHCIESGEYAAAHLVATGTHSGPGLGFAPSGRSFRITGLVMVRVLDGRMVEGWSSFDILSLFEQLGALKRPTLGS
jgi:predicted ester cyclase